MATKGKMFNKIFILSAILLCCVVTFCSCLPPDKPPDGSIQWKVDDVTLWLDQDAFTLHVQGKGQLNLDGNAPWEQYNKNIKYIQIHQGVTHIGQKAFAGINADNVVLPNGLVNVATNSLEQSVKLFYFDGATCNLGDFDQSRLYKYSESAPTGYKLNYWYYKDGIATAWQVTRVLFVGNSFTFRQGTTNAPMVPKYFEQIARSANVYVTVDAFTQSSYTLEKWSTPTDEHGSKLISALKTNVYDVAVLQEQSTRPLTNFASFLQGATALNQLLEKYQPNCKIYLYQTWGYPLKASEHGGSVSVMEQRLFDAYKSVAQTLGADICPVGRAFTLAYTQYCSKYGISLYAEDNFHQSNQGAYLSALVHAKTILGIDVIGNTFWGPFGTEEQKVEALQQVASQVCTTLQY